MRRAGWCLLLGGVFILLGAGMALAGVGTQCFNCHNMHNSENDNLLELGCVGCHSHDGPESIVVMADARIPIVYNTGSAPEAMLAGGNFHWLAKKGDQYGHNVLGIRGQDAILATAPGGPTGCAGSCHQSLALATVSVPGGSRTQNDGCQGCHGSVRHHRPAVAPGTPASAESGWYRFLKAPDFHDFAAGSQGVSGIGDSDWEQNPTSVRHNIYYGQAGSQGAARSLNSFCSSCHRNFHGPGKDANGGVTSPWLRHPTNYAIPNKGEFATVIGREYSPLTPVAKPSLTSYNAATVQQGDLLTCISCHRAHGSAHPDMLRWDYGEMRAHQAGEAAGTGCFYCHTRKDS